MRKKKKKVKDEVPLSVNNKTKVIYDIGANNGDDIPYYIKKADIVVAVEANPVLCKQIQQRFSQEIQKGKLYIVNCVLTPKYLGDVVPFYIHKKSHLLSQFSIPKTDQDSYERVMLSGMSVEELFKKFGDPYYVKIDIEGYDHVILESLFTNNITPKYLSAESHSIKVFLLLATLGGYNLFKIVNGNTMDKQYRNHSILTLQGLDIYSFPRHSAGPFGEDIMGEWIKPTELFRQILKDGLGWKDIHVKNEKNEPMHPSWISFLLWRVRYWYYYSWWLTHRLFSQLKHV